MEKSAPSPESRQSNLKTAFNRCLRCLLTICSEEELRSAFPSFNTAEQERLRRFFISVISTLHKDIEEDFESMLLESQAGRILDNIEELVEEQSLDPLYSTKSNVGEAFQKLSEAKKNELNYLMGQLDKAEEQKRKMIARIELLKKEKQDFSGEKLSS